MILLSILFSLCLSLGFAHGQYPIITINDFSQLNQTIIKENAYPTNYDELAHLLKEAQKADLKLSIAGSLHSQGGHTFIPNGIVIHLSKLNKIINLDAQRNLLTVQAGATWHEIQQFLNPQNRAVKIMQFANLFTVGGSLSVNCNGIDPHCGPLIESVESLKIMLHDGSIVTANRTQNAELFKLAIGGYGLFGIILECALHVVPNDLYKQESKTISLDEYIAQIEQIKNNPLIGFHFAHLMLTAHGKKLFSNVLSVSLKKVDENALSRRTKTRCKKLYKERFIKIKQVSFPLLRKSRLVKSTQWVEPVVQTGKIISRNNIMSPPASHFYCPSKTHTQLLQEYFIPLACLKTFIQNLELITQKLNVNLLHVAFRFIPQNTESFLSYTRKDCIGIVLFISQPITADGMRSTQEWTQNLIAKTIECEGAYYLPIQLHATKEQLKGTYPQIDTFFKYKNKYDPDQLFMNHLYLKYANV